MIHDMKATVKSVSTGERHITVDYTLVSTNSWNAVCIYLFARFHFN